MQNGDGKVGRWQSAGMIPLKAGGVALVLFHDHTGQVAVTEIGKPEAPPMVQPVGAIQRIKP